MKKEFYSNGKILITGEYAVLDGALALAIPTKYGQSLTVVETETKKIEWTSFDEKDKIWLDAKYDLESMAEISSTNSEISKTLLEILIETQRLNPYFLMERSGYHIETKLTFPKDWGLGTSSTLINNIAHWAKVDPYILLKNTFGGSGYDIACAFHNSPITYELKKENPIVKEVHFSPDFKDQLFFVYLNTKQNSREAIKKYTSEEINRKELSKTITAITNRMISSTSVDDLEFLMNWHENEISKALKTPNVKSTLFADYPKAIKSLGAWGGDFIMVVGDESSMSYFKQKGYNTIIPYSEMVL